MRKIAAEIVREKILATTGEEIPYVTAVVTERFDESDPGLTRTLLRDIRRARQPEIDNYRKGRTRN